MKKSLVILFCLSVLSFSLFADLQWQTQFMHDGDIVTFTFKEKEKGKEKEKVCSFIAGFSGFNVGFDGDHHVKNFGAKLSASQVSSNSIQVRCDLTLEDNSGNSGIHSQMAAHVTVVAWVGTSNQACYLGQANDMCGKTVSLNAGKKVIAAAACINSFVIGYPGDDHHVREVKAGVSAQNVSGTNQVNVNGSVGMKDDSGNHGGCSHLSAAVLAPFIKDPGFEMKIASISKGPTHCGVANNTASVTFDKNVTGAIALLSSFNISYDDDHHVLDIMAGNTKYGGGSFPGPAINISGKTVTINVNETMYDDSGNESTKNSANFLVIAATGKTTGKVKKADHVKTAERSLK